MARLPTRSLQTRTALERLKRPPLERQMAELDGLQHELRVYSFCPQALDHQKALVRTLMGIKRTMAGLASVQFFYCPHQDRWIEHSAWLWAPVPPRTCLRTVAAEAILARIKTETLVVDLDAA